MIFLLIRDLLYATFHSAALIPTKVIFSASELQDKVTYSATEGNKFANNKQLKEVSSNYVYNKPGHPRRRFY
jgi:hypothetical protein